MASEKPKPVFLGEDVFADWDNDGDLYLFTSESGEPDTFSAEIWMSEETVSALKRFLATAAKGAA